ncbi:MAG: 50S ribosomal protein L21 [Rickettsiales bacterium]|jgi:large subunit ribosomal protein L21|nr:50S ribosomal protein L21 [Rickettsiales bacterium]
MFVVLETGGKQYKVSEGNKISVEKLNLGENEKTMLGNALFLQRDNGEIAVGRPFLENVKVEVEAIKNYKDDKVLIFKKRRRKNSKRLNGHRQQKTAVKILNIKIS